MPVIFHFTHGSNLSAILTAHELRSHGAAPTVTDIADVSIKARRTAIAVGCGPGGVVGDYVPFYFAPRSPMLFRLEKEHAEGHGDGQRALIYATTTTERLLEAGLRCVFSDGNAAHRLSTFSDDMTAMAKRVDWELMNAVVWADTLEDGDRVRRRQAEFLVHGGGLARPRRTTGGLRRCHTFESPGNPRSGRIIAPCGRPTRLVFLSDDRLRQRESARG